MSNLVRVTELVGCCFGNGGGNGSGIARINVIGGAYNDCCQLDVGSLECVEHLWLKEVFKIAPFATRVNVEIAE